MSYVRREFDAEFASIVEQLQGSDTGETAPPIDPLIVDKRGRADPGSDSGGTRAGHGRDMGGTWAAHGPDMGGTWAAHDWSPSQTQVQRLRICVLVLLSLLVIGVVMLATQGTKQAPQTGTSAASIEVETPAPLVPVPPAASGCIGAVIGTPLSPIANELARSVSAVSAVDAWFRWGSACRPTANPQIIEMIGGLDPATRAQLQQELGRDILRIQDLTNPEVPAAEWAQIVGNTNNVHTEYLEAAGGWSRPLPGGLDLSEPAIECMAICVEGGRRHERRKEARPAPRDGHPLPGARFPLAPDGMRSSDLGPHANQPERESRESGGRTTR